MPEQAPTERTSWSLSEFFQKALTSSFYGGVVNRTVSLALLLESLIDESIVKALIKDDAIPFVTEKWIAPMGRQRKFDLLRSYFVAHGDQTGVQICDQIRSVFALRDKIAHGAIMKIEAETGLHLVTTRNGREHSHQFTFDEIAAILEVGEQAAQDLMPYALADNAQDQAVRRPSEDTQA